MGKPKLMPRSWFRIKNRRGNDSCRIVDSDGRIVAEVRWDRPEWKTDAQLIAAAPELLDAVIRLYAALSLIDDVPSAIDKAELAVFKATGKKLNDFV